MIDHAVKELFWDDSIPKRLNITFSDGDTISNSDLESEKFELFEAISNDTQLQFGSCNSSEVRFPIRNIIRNKIGQSMVIDMIVANNTSNPLRIGTFKVQSDIPTADRTKRDITAYDALYDIMNADVASWYNSILPNSSSSMTLAQFRQSLATNFGILTENQSLCNDSMVVKRTIEPKELSGLEVIRCIGELSGAFPHICRNGKLKYIVLETNIEGLYPSTTLYPSEHLFPRAANGELIKKAYHIPPLKYEDWKVDKITGVTIRENVNDAGSSVGNDTNQYIVTGNFLTYGKTASEKQTIASNLFSVIKEISYRPYSVKAKGNPCIEVGDVVRMTATNARVESYVLNRRLVGIQSLRDELTAEGMQKRSEELNSVRSQYKALDGKIAELQVNSDGITARVSDIENGSASVIRQLSNNISAKVDHTGGDASSFGWQLTNDGFSLQSNGDTVFECTAEGTEFRSENGDQSVVIENGIVKSVYQNSETRLADNGVLVFNRNLNNTYAHLAIQSEPSLTLRDAYGNVTKLNAPRLDLIGADNHSSYMTPSLLFVSSITADTINGSTPVNSSNIVNYLSTYATESELTTVINSLNAMYSELDARLRALEG